MAKPKLTDAELVERTRVWRQAKTEAADAEARARDVQAEILDELARRRTDRLDTDHARLRVVASTRTTYHHDRAAALLPPAQLRRLSITTVSPAAVKAELEAGRLSAEQVDAFSTVATQAAYLRLLP